MRKNKKEFRTFKEKFPDTLSGLHKAVFQRVVIKEAATLV
jgi:hypothetical protein